MIEKAFTAQKKWLSMIDDTLNPNQKEMIDSALKLLIEKAGSLNLTKNE